MRLSIERQALERFPGFYFFKKGKKLGVKGKIYTRNGNCYDIKIIYPDNYPNNAPETFCESSLKRYPPHLLSKNKLCNHLPEEWESKYTIAVIIGWSIKWFDAYEQWKRTGKWKGREA